MRIIILVSKQALSNSKRNEGAKPMIQLTRENTTKATQKAIEVKPYVRIKQFGLY